MQNDSSLSTISPMLLNVGCGKKYHPEWVNIDLFPQSKQVRKANLLKGIPYPDNTFDVVYHSQVLEHFEFKSGENLIRECHRVLKPNGILRVVVPDLENIAQTYINCLNKALDEPSTENDSNYTWIMLELMDQAVRTKSGGMMSEFLNKKEINNENFVLGRIGLHGELVRNIVNYKTRDNQEGNIFFSGIKLFKKAVRVLKRKYDKFFVSEATRLGKFRMSGEVHQWMYDRYSMARLLKKTGFNDVKQMNPFDSWVENWKEYQLDVIDEKVIAPMALYFEAKK